LNKGLGFNIFGTKEKIVVTLEHDHLTTVQKIDKDWRDYEREEKELKDQEAAAMMDMVIGMKNTMDVMMEQASSQSGAQQPAPPPYTEREDEQVEDVVNDNKNGPPETEKGKEKDPKKRAKLTAMARSMLPSSF